MHLVWLPLIDYMLYWTKYYACVLCTQHFFTVVTCNPVYTAIAGGVVTCSDANRNGSQCTFTCNNGYQLVGNDTTLTCKHDGDGINGTAAWDTTPPTCQCNHFQSLYIHI